MKKFLQIDEQILFLKTEGKLEIDNQESLKYYLISYGFCDLIENYDCFFKDLKNENGEYKKGIASSDIIDAFNFDREIAHKILASILNIERRLCCACATILAKTFINNNVKKIIPNFANTNILIKSEDNFLYVFPKLKGQQIDDFKKELIQYNDKICKNTKEEDVPIWILARNWSLSIVIKILANIRMELKAEIIKEYFQMKMVSKSIIQNFLDVMIVLNNIKFRTYHNNSVLNIDVKQKKDSINQMLNNLSLRNNKYQASKSIRLYEIVTIIDYLWHKNTHSLTEQVVGMINELLKRNPKRVNDWKHLLRYIKFE